MNYRHQISQHLFFSITVALLLFLVHSTPAAAQRRYNHLFYKALLAADEKDYKTAIGIFDEILDKSPDNVDALTQKGICLVSNNAPPDSALTLFYRALSIIPKSDHLSDFGIELQLTIARTLKLAEKPDSALNILTRLKKNTHNPTFNKEVQEEISQTRNFAVLLNNPVPLNINNLGRELNSEFDDHSPLVSFSGDKILFTSRRPSGKDHMMRDEQFAEKVYQSEFDGQKWETPKLLADLSTRNKHESILSTSPDYHQFYLFKNDHGNKSIYTSHLVNGKWSEPTKLPAPINSKWDETHACLSADRSTLFFTSSRPGGYGGLDIYMIKKNNFGIWGAPRNAGPNINSDKDEETPMLHPDGKTLYFSSEGHNSIGRFDIFYSQMLPDSTWTLPANMGYPINTPDDDFFFVPSLDKSRAYYASYRFDESAGRSDLYEVEFDSTYEGSLAVIEGTIHNENNLPPEQIRILVARNSDNQQVGDYRPDPTTGKYLLFLESGQSYTLREATPYAITDSTVLNVSESLAYDTVKQVLMVQDNRMIPPLTPQFNPELNTHTLSAVIPKSLASNELLPTTGHGSDTTTQQSEKSIDATDENPEREPIVVREDYQTEENRSQVALSSTTDLNTKNGSTANVTDTPASRLASQKDHPTIPSDHAGLPSISYTVQVLALNKNPKADEHFFDGLDNQDIMAYQGSDGFLRYVIRHFNSASEAINYRKQIQASGRFSDAFIRSWTDLQNLTVTGLPTTDAPNSSALKIDTQWETAPQNRSEQTPTPQKKITETNSPSQPLWKYAVQILALKKYATPQEDYFSGLDKEKIIPHRGTDGFVRYVTLEFKTLDEAIAFQKKIQETGRYSDAFIRRYSDIKSLSTDISPAETDHPEDASSATNGITDTNQSPTSNNETLEENKARMRPLKKREPRLSQDNNHYTYTVQILALYNSPQPPKGFFDGLDQERIISYKDSDGFLKYIIRQFDTLEEAMTFRKEIQKSGRFQDAFIRKYADIKNPAIQEE